MVLDAGRIVSAHNLSSKVPKHPDTLPPQVEFDKPSELLKNPKGKLRALVDESGDKEHLFSMANFEL